MTLHNPRLVFVGLVLVPFLLGMMAIFLSHPSNRPAFLENPLLQWCVGYG